MRLMDKYINRTHDMSRFILIRQLNNDNMEIMTTFHIQVRSTDNIRVYAFMLTIGSH